MRRNVTGMENRRGIFKDQLFTAAVIHGNTFFNRLLGGFFLA
jgi:hypothetical protein